MTGSFAVYVRWLFGWRYISSLHSADEGQEGRNSCPLLRSCFIGSCHVGVSKRFSRSISRAVYRLSSHIFFLAAQISCRSYVGSRHLSYAVPCSFWFRQVHPDRLTQSLSGLSEERYERAPTFLLWRNILRTGVQHHVIYARLIP